MNTLNRNFNPQTFADDILEVRRVYAEFFAILKESDWDKRVKGSPTEWNLHETIAQMINRRNIERSKP